MTRSVTTMTIEDVDHYSAEQKASIIASYPAHEREARAKGIPTMGSGRIFPVEESLLSIPSMPIPKHWPQIIGVDFGFDHPFAAARLAWDRDADTIYVIDCYRERQAIPAIHTAAIRGWGTWVPVAWPHDGLQHDKGSGEQLAAQYKANGMNMLGERATHPDGGHGVEAGLMEMLEKMQTGHFKVFSHLNEWWEEFRLYHRKEGKIVKERDDIMSATRYAVMMLRYAEVERTWSFDGQSGTANSWLSA